MSVGFKVTVLGSGTSTGVPIIGCDCAICRSTDPKNQRTRSSILLTDSKKRHYVVDTGPEFRIQILREKVRSLEAVFYTHLHADHSHGFDDLRAFFFHTNAPLKCYLTQPHIKEMRERFSYAFTQTEYEGTKPQVQFQPIEDYKPFKLNDFEIDSFGVDHGGIQTSVFRFNRFAYATDFKAFTDSQIARWKGSVDTMIASGIHFGRHRTHSVIPETIELFKRLGVRRGIITHLSHDVDYLAHSAKLPAGVEFAYDGMTIDVT